jgi:choline dehydrogenase-like flavoprotein
MPAVPSANTLAATLMVAEKAADLILDRPAAASAPLSSDTARLAAL